MPTSNRSVSHPWSARVSATSRTAVYGPVRTVVWEGRSREAPPYPDIVLAVYVVDDDPDAMGRHRQPVLAAQRALCVFVAALPVLAHGGTGELVVFGVPFIGLLLIDQLKDGDLG